LLNVGFRPLSNVVQATIIPAAALTGDRKSEMPVAGETDEVNL
jgi:hypothetical protein